VRRQGEEEKAAGEHPYPTAELLWRLAGGKKWRSGGAMGGRSLVC
jgi:hypothetical protein